MHSRAFASFLHCTIHTCVVSAADRPRNDLYSPLVNAIPYDHFNEFTFFSPLPRVLLLSHRQRTSSALYVSARTTNGLMNGRNNVIWRSISFLIKDFSERLISVRTYFPSLTGIYFFYFAANAAAANCCQRSHRLGDHCRFRSQLNRTAHSIDFGFAFTPSDFRHWIWNIENSWKYR